MKKRKTGGKQTQIRRAVRERERTETAGRNGQSEAEEPERDARKSRAPDRDPPEKKGHSGKGRGKRQQSLRGSLFRLFLLVVAVFAVVILAAAVSQADVVTPEPTITSDMLRERLRYVQDLVTVEYHYTDADKQELPGKKLFNTIPVPWTKKTFIISYDGVIKYGVDVSQVGLEVNGITKTVTVEIPKGKIISHEIPEEGFRVLYEAGGLFNKITIDDVTQFRMTQKGKMEERANKLEMPQKAQEQSGAAIAALLNAVPGMEEYTLNVEYAS